MSDAEAPLAEEIKFPRKSKLKREAFASTAPTAEAWRIKGVWPSQGVAFVVGATKSGKTFLVLDMTLRLAAGAAKALQRRARQCGVAYLAAEDPNGCRARVAAWRIRNHRTSPTPFELLSGSFNLAEDGDVADLRASLWEIDAAFKEQGAPLGVLVIDTLSRVLPGADENNAIDMSRAVAALDEISRELSILVV